MTVKESQRRRVAWLRSAIAIVLITGLYFVAPLHREDGLYLIRAATLLLGLAAVSWLTALQVRRALRPGRLPAERLALLLTLVTLVSAFFATGYYQMSDQFSGLRTRLDALYFAVTTLATVGYGDITATGQAARALAIVQMLFDLVIVTSAITIVLGAQPTKTSSEM
ncbi:potassium channel family protein [Actinomadura parmotrematis]|uniref:Potassium channel family protein n=1 Tax=Actinomadura parmotrematis TaxID=2864039 RepID=A0ABS7FPF5_9ACTN|nr:potassium channel family protein [Actinomadura parmotrematis]MBW8482283.1 potassium channel family protein [Actinomadura parmotrematis]